MLHGPWRALKTAKVTKAKACAMAPASGDWSCSMKARGRLHRTLALCQLLSELGRPMWQRAACTVGTVVSSALSITSWKPKVSSKLKVHLVFKNKK